MASNRERISTQYECSKFGAVVRLDGVKATLPGQQAAAQIAIAYTACSGMPTCGFVFGALPCPYRN